MGKQKEMSTKVHFKMYKTGRTWAIAGIGILSLALGTVSTTQNINAAAVDSNVPVSKVADSAAEKPVKTPEATATVTSTKENKTPAPTAGSKAENKEETTPVVKTEDKKTPAKVAEPKTKVKTISDETENGQDSTDDDYVDHSKVSLTNVMYTAKKGQVLNVRELFKGATDVDGADIDYSKITVEVSNSDGVTINKSVGSNYLIDTSVLDSTFGITYSFINSDGQEVSSYLSVDVFENGGTMFSNSDVENFYENQKFLPENYFLGATKMNNEDVPFSEIDVDTSKLDVTTPGTYVVTYTFLDSDDSVADFEIPVTVLKDQSKLNIKNITLNKGEDFSSDDYGRLASAIDSDGTVHAAENYDLDSIVDTSKPGVYKVAFEFDTLSGKVLTGTSVVTVKDTNTGSGTNNGTGNTNTGSGTNNGTGNTGSGTNNGTGNTNKENTLSNGTGNTNNGTSNANKENTLSTGTKVLAPMAESGNANNKLNSETLPQTGEASESNVTIMGAVLLVLSSFIGIFTFSNKNQKN
ncbi:bacterial Ig-like domain-containing protein [Dellaglioa algida]|uniref:bacterial Ig-like domain-containing protein n=1 Tax=Dellaglioa algida TaxID=105612 RepID=UPI0024C49A2B|nr:bacterial Ig-like domain-containing protein [Dellaglioa algida]MDK1723121.1 bacterial Ig-like domain-containing protein [Dellaglioa algida]